MSTEVSLQVLAGLKVLVALAKADGVVHDNERLAIESALEEIDLPEGTTIDGLIEAKVDLDTELATIQNPEVRQQTFDSACALVYVDGEASAVERAMLEKVRAAFAFGAEDKAGASARFQTALDRAFAPLAAADAAGSSERAFVVDDEVQRFAVFGAALSSLSLPTFCDGLPLANEVRLAQKIGAFYGRRSEAGFWKTFVGNLVGVAASRLALSSLARIAGLGGASRSANAYASAYAIGKTTKHYFEKDEAPAPDALRAVFRDAKREGMTAAKDARGKIDAQKVTLEAEKKALDGELASKTIDEPEYERRLLRHE